MSACLIARPLARRIDRLQPIILPENKAGSLATPVAGAITSCACEVYSRGHFSSSLSGNLLNGIAGLVRRFRNLESQATVTEHLWHERQGVHLPSLVKRRKYFFGGQDLNPVTCGKS